MCCQHCWSQYCFFPLLFTWQKWHNAKQWYNSLNLKNKQTYISKLSKILREDSKWTSNNEAIHKISKHGCCIGQCCYKKNVLVLAKDIGWPKYQSTSDTHSIMLPKPCFMVGSSSGRGIVLFFCHLLQNFSQNLTFPPTIVVFLALFL